ncbi:MAG TPA: hypothetical protein PK082_02140, partial [Phycisphaerae bacterium]|nr:hypothetical protein [Phycisphaerae bacterium]
MMQIILPTCLRRFLATASCVAILLAIGAAGLADAPRVAVWNPETGAQSSRFRIDPKYLDD